MIYKGWWLGAVLLVGMALPFVAQADDGGSHQQQGVEKHEVDQPGHDAERDGNASRDRVDRKEARDSEVEVDRRDKRENEAESRSHGDD
ncbi:MAG: hypothetical protein Q9M26_01780 [Mariprofundales bacterium]|nr:hypothetical protein [Mariprofundales bacterium]